MCKISSKSNESFSGYREKHVQKCRSEINTMTVGPYLGQGMRWTPGPHVSSPKVLLVRLLQKPLPFCQCFEFVDDIGLKMFGKIRASRTGRASETDHSETESLSGFAKMINTTCNYEKMLGQNFKQNFILYQIMLSNSMLLLC